MIKDYENFDKDDFIGFFLYKNYIETGEANYTDDEFEVLIYKMRRDSDLWENIYDLMDKSYSDIKDIFIENRKHIIKTKLTYYCYEKYDIPSKIEDKIADTIANDFDLYKKFTKGDNGVASHLNPAITKYLNEWPKDEDNWFLDEE